MIRIYEDSEMWQAQIRIECFFSGVIAVRLIVIIGAIKVEVNGKCFQELQVGVLQRRHTKKRFQVNSRSW